MPADNIEAIRKFEGEFSDYISILYRCIPTCLYTVPIQCCQGSYKRSLEIMLVREISGFHMYHFESGEK